MDKDTLFNPDESFKTNDGEYRAGRSSILKPQKARTPFQEVTFRLATEDGDLTNRTRRVSFANVNIVKEFCSKTESQHIGNIEPYEETFAQSDSSCNSNRNSTGLPLMSPGKQESPNSSCYNDESMELTSNSICEPNQTFGPMNPRSSGRRSEIAQEHKNSFLNMEKSFTNKESSDANMSMTNVLNFPQIGVFNDKENLFKRNHFEMSDNEIEFTEPIPIKIVNRTSNFPKDHESSVMEFTEVLPVRLINPSLEDQCQDLSIEDKHSETKLTSKRKPRRTLKACDEVDEGSEENLKSSFKENPIVLNSEENENDHVDMSLVTTGFTGISRCCFKPNQKDDPGFNIQDLTASSMDLRILSGKQLQPMTNLKKSIDFGPETRLESLDMSLLTSNSANRTSIKHQDASINLMLQAATRLSANPFKKDDSVNSEDSPKIRQSSNARKSWKPFSDNPEEIQNVSADSLADDSAYLNSPKKDESVGKNLPDCPTIKLSVETFEKDDSAVDNQDHQDLVPPETKCVLNVRKSLKPSYPEDIQNVSADMSLADCSTDSNCAKEKPDRRARLSIYQFEKDDSMVNNQDESSDSEHTKIVPIKIIKPSYKDDTEHINAADMSSERSTGQVKFDRPAARLSIYPFAKDDSITDNLINSDLERSEIGEIGTRKSVFLDSLPPEPSFSFSHENIDNGITRKKTFNNDVQNISLSMSLLPADLTSNDYVQRGNLEKSLLPDIAPLSCEETKKSFMYCETEEIDRENYKASFKYNADLEGVSFGQKSVIPMELNESSVMDEDIEKIQEPIAQMSEVSPSEICITPYGKGCNINNKPKEALTKTPKSKNSEMDKFELYNLKMKSILFMEKHGFEWMSYLKWKLEIYDHFYLVIELSQTLEINDATRIDSIYFFRGPYVKEADILDFVENNFRANFPNLQCSIVQNITKIQKQIHSFWKEQEQIVKAMRNLRLRYPFTLEDQKMTFTIYNIDKKIVFDVTINFTDWRTGIKKEHISLKQSFGTVSERLVKHLFPLEDIDLIKYISDLQQFVFINK